MALSGTKATTLNKHRARLYREHKYVFFVFSDLIQFIGALDFSKEDAIVKAKDRVRELKSLLEGHADYEESRIHTILKNKDSQLFQKAEVEHKHHNIFFDKSESMLADIESSNDPEDKHDLGYRFYLDLREFFAQNLIHFDYEERVILPELQKLANDEDIREIDSQSYRQMIPEQMIHMMEVLFPHMNKDDRFTFLKDIKECQPDKFDVAWQGIAPKIEESERVELRQSLKQESSRSH